MLVAAQKGAGILIPAPRHSVGCRGKAEESLLLPEAWGCVGKSNLHSGLIHGIGLHCHVQAWMSPHEDLGLLRLLYTVSYMPGNTEKGSRPPTNHSGGCEGREL